MSVIDRTRMTTAGCGHFLCCETRRPGHLSDQVQVLGAGLGIANPLSFILRRSSGHCVTQIHCKQETMAADFTTDPFSDFGNTSGAPWLPHTIVVSIQT